MLAADGEGVITDRQLRSLAPAATALERDDRVARGEREGGVVDEHAHRRKGALLRPRIEPSER